MKIFGWAADYTGCGYYRIGLPLNALQAHGHSTYASGVFPISQQDSIDLVIGQRVCIDGATDRWQQLKKAGKPLVFEIDDDLFHVHRDNELAYDFFNKPGVQERLRKNIAVADLVTVTNDYLADQMEQYNPNVEVLPNCVPMKLLDHERKRNDKLTIGWAGSTTHKPDFLPIANHIRRVLQQRPQVDMHFIGTDYSYLIKHEARFTPWVEDVVEYVKLMDFDIGIAPLAPDHFNKSKSYIKALEYAVLGIPVIASDYGPYREFVRHGETGFLVKYEHEWPKYLRMLIDDEDMRNEMGKTAREYAIDFTIEKNAWRWDEAYRSVIG